MRNKPIVFCILFAAQTAFAIGRVGNKLPDTSERYVAALPSHFDSVENTADGGVILESGLYAAIPSLGVATEVAVDLQMLPFHTQYPSLQERESKAVEAYFRANSAVKYREIHGESGELKLLGISASSVSGVAYCGKGRGFVVFGPKHEVTLQGVEDLLKSARFQGSCR